MRFFAFIFAAFSSAALLSACDVADGHSCTVYETEAGTVIECEDGTSSTVTAPDAGVGPEGPEGPPGPAGEVLVSEGTSGFQPYDCSSCYGAFEPSFIRYSTLGTDVAGDGRVMMSLLGLNEMAGEEYGLAWVEYCIFSLSQGAYVAGVNLSSLAGTFVSDGTDRTSSGCYRLDVNASLSAYNLSVNVDGGGWLRITRVESLWVPVSSLPE